MSHVWPLLVRIAYIGSHVNAASMQKPANDVVLLHHAQPRAAFVHALHSLDCQHGGVGGGVGCGVGLDRDINVVI